MNKEREKMKRYLEQLASIKEELESLYCARVDVDDDTLTSDEKLVLQDSDNAVNSLLDIINYYCEE